MADIRPFRAYRYATERVRLQDVLTQPYDKITPRMQERYYAASPYNLIAVEKGRSLPEDSPARNVYTRAAEKLEQWIADKILVRDAAPSLYVYAQEFVVPGTATRRVRWGFIGLVRVEDYDAKVVFRHERTLSGPKADRIELLRHTRAQTGQLFLLYDDPARQTDRWLEEAARQAAPAEMQDEYGVLHRLWPIADPDFLARMRGAMAEKKLVIADGHHRYETALAYRNECRLRAPAAGPRAASEFAMATFINTRSPGLAILPTHRVVSGLPRFDFDEFRKKLAPWFDWYSYPFAGPQERSASWAEFRRALDHPQAGRRAIGLYAGPAQAAPAFYLFVLRRGVDLETLLPEASEAQRELDVLLLHRLIFEKGLGITAEAVAAEQHVGYEREMDAALAAVDGGQAQLAFLLNSIRVQQVVEIALTGGVLPQKSTDFYPKLLSGLAIYRLEGKLDESA